MKPKLSIFFCDSSGMISWLVKRVTSGEWSHTGIAIGDQYWEAHAYGHKGFRGPKPVQKLIDWSLSKSGNRLRFVDIPATPEQVGQVRDWCRRTATLQQAPYDVWQLIRIWAVRRFAGKWGFSLSSDPSKLICSEAVARALAVIGIDLTSKDYPTPDQIDPGECWRALQRWLAHPVELVAG